MPRVTQDYLDTRRREILAAAHRCFAKKGFRDTTMRQIADEAGLTAGALYGYFDDKASLIRALAEWGREQKREAMRGIDPGSGVDGLASLVEELLGSLPTSGQEDHPVRFDVRIWGEALGRPPLHALVEGELADFGDLLAGYLEEEQSEGRIREDVDVGAAARIMISLLTGFELQTAYDPDLDAKAYAGFVRRLLGTLGPAGD